MRQCLRQAKKAHALHREKEKLAGFGIGFGLLSFSLISMAVHGELGTWTILGLFMGLVFIAFGWWRMYPNFTS